MKTRIIFITLVAVVALLGIAMYAGAEEWGMKGDPNATKMKAHAEDHKCPCMMCCSKEGKEKCKGMGMSEPMMERCKMMMHTRINANAPESLIAMKKDLMLTTEQIDKLESIVKKSQEEAEAVLTAEQKEKVAKYAKTPETMMKMHEEMMGKMKEKHEMMGKKDPMDPNIKEPNSNEPNNTSMAKSTETEQTTCPVTGKPINKEYWTVYKGKIVYFCCPNCKPVFEKDPEKYISKLPQFKK